MQTKRITTVLIAVFSLSTASAHAQGIVFDAGSDGSLGSLTVNASETLDLPDDGIFHFTTLTVAGGATLRFNRNPLNTPVYILATGDIVIDGTIDVSGADGTSSPPVGGAGGPGGFDGGDPGFGPGNPAGAGHGPGGGSGGANSSAGDDGAGGGAYAGRPTSLTARDGLPYGSALLVPLVGGSGSGGRDGQPGVGGGGGGGAVLLASNTGVRVTGSVNALGARGLDYNQGSGGAIRIVAPIVSGGGILNAQGGSHFDVGGHGRIRIDAINRRSLQLRFTPPAAASVGGFMAVFPDVVPRLDIVEVAGEPIPVGQPDPVLVFLPFGSTAARTVVVQGTDFAGQVPITVALTPDSGDRLLFDAEIDMDTGNPATVEVPVDFPINRTTRVSAWTRDPSP